MTPTTACPAAAPGPPPISPNDARRSRLRLLDSVAATDDPVVRHEIANRSVIFVNEPELIRQVLVTRAASFEKSEFQRRVMGAAEGSETGLGNGMLTSSNATSRHQHKLIGRIFSPAAIRNHVQCIAQLARELRDQWADGARVELGSAFMRLSARIAARTLFSWEFGPGDDDIVGDLDLIGGLLGRSAGRRAAGWEDPSVIEGAARHLEDRLLALVADRRARGSVAGPGAGDLVDLLLAAQAGQAKRPTGRDDSYPITDRQIRDDLMTLFITGAENPRNALTWAFYLLARHPEAAQRVYDEIRATGAADGHITLDVLKQLPYALQVFKEALRLFPPGYAFGRRAIENADIGSLVLERGTEVVISPYALHRRPGLFAQAYDFMPERFEQKREAMLRPYSYLPFGVGPRSCIGGAFAMLEGHIVLAVLLGGLRFTPASDEIIEPEPRMTLRPSGAVTMFVTKGARHE